LAFPADRNDRHAAVDGTSCVQKAHRLAAIGMLLRQYGHSRVFATAGVSVLRRFISALTGRTTKKKTTAAMIKNETTALMKSPRAYSFSGESPTAARASAGCAA